MQHGRGTLTHSDSQRSSRWSDDEMSDFLPFEEPLQLCPSFIVNEEEERYLAELVHHQMLATELALRYPGSIKGSLLNYNRSLQDVPGYYVPTRAPVSENLLEPIQLNGGNSQYRDKKWAKKNPFPDRTLPNPNSRKNNSEKPTQVHVQVKGASTPATIPKKETNNVVSEKKAKKKTTTAINDDEQRVFLG